MHSTHERDISFGGTVSFFVAAMVWLVAIGSVGAWADDPPTVMHDAMKVAPVHIVDAPMVNYRTVFFATNRKIHEEEFTSFKRERRPLNMDKLLSEESDMLICLGSVQIGYPANRKLADQNYASQLESENPLYYFTILRPKFFHSPDEFRVGMRQENVAEDRVPPTTQNQTPSIIYVHGWNNSFSGAAERAAQLKVDLDHDGPMVLMSWPSNQGLPPSGYWKALKEEAKTKAYLAYLLDILNSEQKTRSNLIAHSMGAKLFLDTITSSIQEFGKNSTIQSELLSVILAAPDVSKNEFVSKMNSLFSNSFKSVTVYCSDYRALLASEVLNNSDIRLGYCDAPSLSAGLRPSAGLRIVAVSGKIADFARHSYFLSAPELLKDMKAVLTETFKDSLLRLPTPDVQNVRTLILQGPLQNP